MKPNHDHTDHPATGPRREEVYVYEHSGIQERHGKVPLWLLGVVFGLIAWSIYYMIRFWNAE